MDSEARFEAELPRFKRKQFWSLESTTCGHYGGSDFRNSLILLPVLASTALRSAMEKLDAGRINPVGGVGNQIAVARESVKTVQTL
jgi:hypothetical protein